MRAQWARWGRGGAVLGLALACAAAGWAARRLPTDCRVTVHILNDHHQPVANAGVVLDQVADLHRHRVKNALDVELKSDTKGNASLEGFVPGVLLVQVIAPGYNTFGKYYYVRQQKTVIQVQLQPPGHQVTAFH